MKSILRIFGLVVVLGAGVAIGYFLTPKSAPAPVASASPVVSLTPTATPDDMIIIDYPKPGDVVTSPLHVTGKARGNWFFEATFPVTLTDWDGKVMVQTTARAQSDWMTTDWVPFDASLSFTPDTTVSSRGALTLKKDNPSGDPARDDHREITVFFK